MDFGSEKNDAEFSPKSLNGSFRKSTTSGNNLDSSPARSLEGCFRKSGSAISMQSSSGISTKSVSNSRRLNKYVKDYRRKMIDLKPFATNLEDWIIENRNAVHFFRSPFQIDDLLKLDLALEAVLFQQLCRMPCTPYSSNYLEEEEYFALEDFLYTVASGLWRTFWHKSGPFPFFLACSRHPGSKFYTIEKAISRGKIGDLSGLALIAKSESNSHVRWDQVMEFALFRPNILTGNRLMLSPVIICEALLYGFHILISRAVSKSSKSFGDSVFVLVFDSRFGGVVKIGGDLSTLEPNPTNPYVAAVEWITCHADISISSVDCIWNKLGNANWRDIGTLQVLSATFHSIVQRHGPPRNSIASLASDHSVRLHKRRLEFRLIENEVTMMPLRCSTGQKHGGIVEEHNQVDNQSLLKDKSRLKLKREEILMLDDQLNGQMGFQIQDSFIGGNHFLYSAVSIDSPSKLLSLYVGAHPSRLEPSWEDMSLWYQVQRQTKVLNILRQRGISCRYLPEIIASGRILHSGHCMKQSPSGRCDHPTCGTPILVTSPVGEPLSFVFAQNGPFSSDEALRCCRDCLVALGSAAAANVQHGDVCPENVFRGFDRHKWLYVPVSWGRAILEERDSPAINLYFSSSHALQCGKLCLSSDAESLVYLIFFVCGGTMQQQDSIESALQWREKIWKKRLIQQKLSKVSPLLKAFADYVDSLCGTPYPVDYDVWVTRLSKAVDESRSERGKMIEELPITLRLEDAAESSGTSVAGV